MVDQSPEELLEQQKAQCIFCKIIKGEIPSRKVYEDDSLLAILDIRPAVKGHVLVIPKEHYPLLPLVPLPVMKELFFKTFEVVKAVKKALLVPRVNLFFANGAVAGQQSPHFLFHLMPQDEGVSLPFDSLDGSFPVADNQSVLSSFSSRLPQVFSSLKSSFSLSVPSSSSVPSSQSSSKTAPSSSPSSFSPVSSSPVPSSQSQSSSQPVSEDSLNKLIQTINSNPDLLDAVVNRPDEVKEAVKKYPKWRDLFGGVDIDALSKNLKVMMAARATEKFLSSQQAAKPSGDDVAGTNNKVNDDKGDVVK